VFPEEPLFLDLRWARTAVDLSPNNPAFRDKIADLSATLQGVSKDEILGEDVLQHRRTKRVAWTVGVALAVLTVASIAGASIAWIQRNEAVRQRNFAFARQLAAQADLARAQPGNEERSVILATEAIRILSSMKTPVLEVDLSLRRALELLQERRLGGSTAVKPSLSADGRFVTTVDLVGGRTVWDAATGFPVRSVEQFGPSDYRVDASGREVAKLIPTRAGSICAGTPDGRFVVLHGIRNEGDGPVEVWDTHAVVRVASLELPPSPWPAESDRPPNYRCDISPDGTLVMIMTGNFDKGNNWRRSTRIWSTRQQREVLARRHEEFRAFSPVAHISPWAPGCGVPRSGGEATDRDVCRAA
jgi:hypothetical protein